MTLGTRVIYETRGKRTKLDLDQIIYLANGTDKRAAIISNNVLLQINKYAPTAEHYPDRYTVYFISPSSKDEYKKTGNIVLVRQICYFKKEIYDKF